MRTQKSLIAGLIRVPLVTLIALTVVAVGAVSAQSPWIDGSDKPAPTPVVGVDVPFPNVARPVEQPVQAAVAQEVLAVASVITYQGRLVTPSTGVNKPDGTYEMSFRLYNHATATAQANLVWGPETQNLVVSKGLFSAALGSVTPFGAAVFNGQNLWLGVTVGTDPELAPRTRITAVAYALYAENAANAANANYAQNANLLDGIDSTTFATEAEVMPIVTSSDGAGSQVDADYLDGLDSTNFARNLGYGVAYSGQCLNVGVASNFYHYQVASADDVRIWKIRPASSPDNTQFEIINFSFRRHFGNYAYHFQVRNSGNNGGAGGVNGCFDIVFYRLQ